MPEFFSLLGMLLTVVAVLALAYFCTRYLAGRTPGGRSGGRYKGMQMLDQLPLGRDSRLALVRVGERYLLLGVTPSSVSQLAELTGEEAKLWQQEAATEAANPSFREAFLEAVKRRGK